MRRPPGDEIVGGFLRNDREMIAGSISDFHGKTYVHLRTFVPSAREEGEWVRTEKGVAIPADRFEEVRVAVHSLWDMMGTDVVAARIPRNNQEEIRVGLNEFHGGIYCYVRTYFRAGKEWQPSRKGVSISTSRLEDLDHLVDEIAEKLKLDSINHLDSINPEDL